MTEQLQELGKWKVGEKVVVSGGGWGNPDHIATIDKITSGHGGTIFVDGSRYTEGGWMRGGDGYNRTHITPATPELMAEVWGKNARSKLANYKWEKLEPAEAKKYIYLLREAGLDI